MKKHSNKHIRAAVEYALEQGWRLHEPGGKHHAWGVLYCPKADRDGCHFSVWSTPRNPEGHARYIRRYVDRCPHKDH